MEKNITIRARLYETLATVNLILLIYTIFLTILGLIIRNTEVIIQSCIMYVVYFVFEYINYDSIIITNKGIKCQKYDFIPWDNLYRLEYNKNIIYIYSKDREKPFKIIYDNSEDPQEIDRAKKYILSKIKDPEKLKKK